MTEHAVVKTTGLTPYVSPLGAWALAMGTSIGWGSLVVTSNTYLSQAGPWGSFIGLVIGAILMLVISRNYHYLINCFPDAGGAYAFSKEVFGHDHGFLTAWFLALTYFAMLWANATSLPLFARYFIGDAFKFGRMYTLFGYDVYIGETLLTIVAIILVAFVCSKFKKAIMAILIVLVIIFTVGITVCFAAALFGHGGLSATTSPAFLPDKNELSQVIRIACISPWAFIGFENISHASEEFTFPRKKVFRLLTIVILVTTALYVFVLLLSSAAYPEQYNSWMEYIADHGNLSGIEGLPAFYAAYHFMGQTGVLLLILALFALIITSLIGNILALSRLLYALGKDSVLPTRFAQLNKRQIPGKAIFLIAVISSILPFVGRTAIGWIVDVTTIGATLIYGFVSASALRMARNRNDRIEKWTGAIGLIVMIVLAGYLLLPNLFGAGFMEKETLFLLIIWGILGFVFFRSILKRDKNRNFGKSIIVWIALLFIVLFVSMIWMNQSLTDSTNQAVTHVNEHYIEEEQDASKIAENEEFLFQEIRAMRSRNVVTTTVVTVLFAASLTFLLTNFSYINKRARKSEEELGIVKDMANTDPLTGVKSKHAFVEKENNLNQQIAENTLEDFSIVVCDVNGLKHINDTYGHKAGDEYIRSASRLICAQFQHSPVYRIGGDEFVVVLHGADYDQRENLMQKLNEQVEAHIGTENVVLSAGISDFDPGKDENMHEVFERADSLMYQRKQELKAMGARTR